MNKIIHFIPNYYGEYEKLSKGKFGNTYGVVQVITDVTGPCHRSSSMIQTYVHAIGE